MDNIWIPDSFVLRSEISSDNVPFDSESSFDSLGSVVDANVDFRRTEDDIEKTTSLKKTTFVDKQPLPLTKVIPEPMQNTSSSNVLNSTSNSGEQDSSLTPNYPEISLPVAHYMNEKNPEWCTEAEKYLKLMQMSKLQASCVEESVSSSIPLSPFNSMTATTEALALQHSVIGNQKVKPASPDVVAEVVAAMQKKLQQQKDSCTNHVPDLAKELSLKMDVPCGPQQQPSPVAKNIVNNSRLPNMAMSSTDNQIPDSRRSSISSISSISSRKHTLENAVPAVHSSHRLPKHLTVHNSPPIGGKLVFMDHFLDSETESCFSEKLEIESNCSETFDTESNLSDTSGICGDTFLSSTSSNALGRHNPSDISKPAPIVNGLVSSAESVARKEQATETESSELFDIMRAKANLEGRLESISQKEVDLSKECLSLQTLVTSLQTQVTVLTKQSEQAVSEKQHALQKVELLGIQQEKWNNVFKEYQNMIDSKNAEIESLKETISDVEQSNIQAKINYEELKVDLESKEGAVVGLKKKIAELHGEVQVLLQTKVQLRNDVQNGKHDIDMLQKSKQWYQDQLHSTQESRDKLHKDFVCLQADNIALNNGVEKSKTEMKHLKQQLAENHQRAMAEKEGLLKHLETIEADMMERELLFDEMQKDKGSVENAFNDRAKRMEEERSKLTHLMLNISDLETEMNTMKSDVCDKSKSIAHLEKEKAELYKQVALLQKTVSNKDLTCQHLLQNLKDANSKIAHYETSLKSLESLLELLKEEKNKADMALAASDKERCTVNESLKALKSNLGGIENNFKQMKSELVTKTAKVEQLTKEKLTLQEHLKRSEEMAFNQQRNFEQQIGLESHNNSVIVDDLKKQKLDVENILKVYGKEMLSYQQQIQALDLQNKNLNNELFKFKSKVLENQGDSPNFNDEMSRANPEDVWKVKAECQQKLKVYRSNIKVLTRKLKEKLKEVDQLQKEFQLLKESNNQTKETSNLSNESVIDTSKMLEMEEEMRTLRASLNEEQSNVQRSQKIIIELEKERGKMTGAQDNSITLKLRVGQLEEELAKKDTTTIKLSSRLKELEATLKEQNTSHQNKISYLEGEVAKNNVVLKGLRQQVFLEKRTNSHNHRQLASLKSGLEQANQIADTRKQNINALQLEVEAKMQLESKYRAEREQLQTQILSLQAEIKKLKNEVQEVNAKDPEVAQQIISLTWHLKERKNEAEALKEKIALVEEGHGIEVVSLEKTLQVLQSEMEKSKSELDVIRKQKFHYQSQLMQLRKAFKTNFGKDAVDQGEDVDNDESKLNASDVQHTFDDSYVNSLLEKSLQISESRPLHHLQACLNSLKQEMADLQMQLHRNDAETIS